MRQQDHERRDRAQGIDADPALVLGHGSTGNREPRVQVGLLLDTGAAVPSLRRPCGSGPPCSRRAPPSVTGRPDVLSELCAASRIFTISTPERGVRARRLAGLDRAREVGQLEAERLGGLEARRDHVAGAVGQLVLAEVLAAR